MLRLAIDLLVVSNLALLTCMCGWLGFGFFYNYFPFHLYISSYEVSPLDFVFLILSLIPLGGSEWLVSCLPVIQAQSTTDCFGTC